MTDMDMDMDMDTRCPRNTGSGSSGSSGVPPPIPETILSALDGEHEADALLALLVDL